MILEDGTILLVLSPMIIVLIAGAVILVRAILEEKSATTHVFGIMLMIAAVTLGIIVERNITPVSVAVDDIHHDAEIIEGEIESIGVDPNKGLAITVDGDIIHITPQGDASNGRVPLKDNNRYTYTNVKPEVGDTLGYKDYSFRDRDYTYAVSYTEKDQNE